MEVLWEIICDSWYVCTPYDVSWAQGQDAFYRVKLRLPSLQHAWSYVICAILARSNYPSFHDSHNYPGCTSRSTRTRSMSFPIHCFCRHSFNAPMCNLSVRAHFGARQREYPWKQPRLNDWTNNTKIQYSQESKGMASNYPLVKNANKHHPLHQSDSTTSHHPIDCCSGGRC